MDTELQERFNKALTFLWAHLRLAEASGSYGGCGFCVGMGQEDKHSQNCKMNTFLHQNDPTGMFDDDSDVFEE